MTDSGRLDLTATDEWCLPILKSAVREADEIIRHIEKQKAASANRGQQ